MYNNLPVFIIGKFMIIMKRNFHWWSFFCLIWLNFHFSNIQGNNLTIHRIYDIEGNIVNQLLPSNSITIEKCVKRDPYTEKKIVTIPYDVFEIPNAYYFSSLYNGIHFVFDNASRIIQPASGHIVSLYNPNRFHNFHLNLVAKANVTVDGNILYLRCSCHYWHFHYETLSQLIIYLKAGIFEKYENQTKQKNYLLFDLHCHNPIMIYEILQFYGFLSILRKWTILKIRNPEYFVSGCGIQLTSGTFITSTTTSAAGYLPIIPTAKFINEKVMNYYSLLPHHPRKRKLNRIFIGREDKNTRGISNMNELLPILEKYQIIVFNPGINASYSKQLFMFSHSELVIGVSGTGFSTNIAFCHVNETVMIEIIPPTPATMTGRQVADALLIKHYFRFHQSYNASDETRNANFYVNITSFEEMIVSSLALLP